MEVCYVVGAMESDYQIKKNPKDLVIAADGGYKYLHGVCPDYVVGDFDSLGYLPKGVNVIRHPVRKDDTDMLLGVKIGLEKGYKKFVLIGGLGGRLDHSIANMQVLAYLKNRGADGVLKGEGTDVYLIKNESMTFPADTEGGLAVFSYGEAALGVSIKGAEYEMINGSLNHSFPLGVSNAFIGKETIIQVEQGCLLIIHDTLHNYNRCY